MFDSFYFRQKSYMFLSDNGQVGQKKKPQLASHSVGRTPSWTAASPSAAGCPTASPSSGRARSSSTARLLLRWWGNPLLSMVFRTPSRVWENRVGCVWTPVPPALGHKTGIVKYKTGCTRYIRRYTPRGYTCYGLAPIAEGRPLGC